MGAVRWAVLGMVWAAVSFGGAFEARAGDGYTVPRTDDLDGQTWILEATPDGSKVYLLDLPPLEDDAQGKVFVLDGKTGQLLSEIPLGFGFPLGAASSADGSHIYVSISKAGGTGYTPGENRVEIIDVATDQIVSTVPLLGGSAYGPYGVEVTADDTKAYVPDRGTDLVWIVDLTTDSVAGTIPLSGAPNNIQRMPDGRHLLVTRRATAEVSVIDSTTDTIVGTAATDLVPAPGDYVCVAPTPDGARTYVTSIHDNRIAVLDTDPSSATYLQQIDTLTTDAIRLAYTSVTENGKRLVVSSVHEREVLVFDVEPRSLRYHQLNTKVRVVEAPIAIQSVGRKVSRIFVASFFGALIRFELRTN